MESSGVPSLPRAADPQSGRLCRVGRGEGATLTLEQGGKEAGGKDNRELRQTPQRRSESELAVRTAPRRLRSCESVPGGGVPSRHLVPITSFPMNPHGRAQLQPSHPNWRPRDSTSARGPRRKRSPRAAGVGPAGYKPPPANSLVGCLLGLRVYC